MTDHLLLEYFKNYKGDNSDLFEGSQMERTLISYTGSKARLAYTGAFASLFSFLLLSKAKAQVNVSEMDKGVKKMQRSAGSAGEITKPADALKSKPARIEIKGRIVDESGGGIPYASVQVQAEKWADSLGNYTLQVPAKIDSVVLVYSAVGFENVERNMMLTDDANQRQDICLGLKPYLGEVVVTGYSTELRTYIAGEVSTVKHSISRKSKAPLCDSNLFPARYISISPRLLQAFFFRLSLQVISAGAF